MFGALAEFERSLIRERTQAGLAAARRAGRTGASQPRPTVETSSALSLRLVSLLYQKGRDSRIFQAQDRAIDDFTLKRSRRRSGSSAL